MFDYKEKIRDFILLNFEASTPEECNCKMNSIDFLNFIFQTFPDGCISDYDLNEVLIKLGFSRYTYTIEIIEFVKKVETKRYELQSAWCMNSLSLKKTIIKNE